MSTPKIFENINNKLPLSGGTLTGSYLGLKNGYSGLEGNEAYAEITSRKIQNDGTNHRSLRVASGAEDKKDSVNLIDYVNGNGTSYRIYGQHNKPEPQELGTLRVFRGTADLGYTGTVTMEQLIEAMPNESVFIQACGASWVDNGIIPELGSLTILRLSDVRVTCFLSNKYGNNLYYACYASDQTPKFRGWKKIAKNPEEVIRLDKSNGAMGYSEIYKNNSETKDYGTIIRDRDKDGNTASLLVDAYDNTVEFIANSGSSYKLYGEHYKPTYETVGAPSKTGSGASGTWPINISGTAATSTGINTYKVINFTTPSAGWYRIATINSLSIPRGQVRFSVVGKGGSSTPLTCDVKIDTSWSDSGVNEISTEGSKYHISGVRVGNDGSNTFIEIYTPNAISATTQINVPYNLVEHWQNTKWTWVNAGALPTSTSTTISYSWSAWQSGISTSNHMTSSGFYTPVNSDYSNFRARSMATGTSSAPSNMGNGEMWIKY